MVSTYSTRLRLEKQASGENSNTWGTILNDNVIELLDEAFGVVSVTHDDTANYSLTANSGATDEARYGIIHVGGTLTAARNLIVPDAGKLYLIYNNTTGGFDITVKTSAGTGITVANAAKSIIYSDATNVVSSGALTAASTDTMTNKSIDLTDNTLTGTTAEFNTALSDGSFTTLAGSEALTNKTIDGDLNTVSNLVIGAEVTGASTALTDTAAITYNADSDVSGNTWVLDEDTMSSNSATKVPTQQSVKAYVDSNGGGFTEGTAQTPPTAASTISFSSIPSGTKRITVIFDGITSGNDVNLEMRIGDSGGLETTGYEGPSITDAVLLSNTNSGGGDVWNGVVEIRRVDTATHVWLFHGSVLNEDNSNVTQIQCSKTLSAELDRLALNLSGAGNFSSAGTINIHYE